MKALSAELPEGSLVRSVNTPDYTDAFMCQLPYGWNRTPDDVAVDFWTVMPQWVGFLFKVRNIIVRPFGLQGGKGSMPTMEQAIRTGEGHGFVSIPAKSPCETVIKLSDTHLDAWMSFMFARGNVYAITVVKYNKRLGRAYFFFIRPFHKVIVRSMLKSSIKRLSDNK